MQINWQKEILTPAGKDLFPKLSKIDELQDFYLVGGTALSLYLGHRESIDFDFFTKKNFGTFYASKFRKLADGNSYEIDWQLLVNNDSALEFILNDVKIFLWENHYPLIGEINNLQGLNVASPIDIGLLKLIAVNGRTTWKDIVDLYFFDKQVMSIKDLIKKYIEIYPKDCENLYNSITTHLNLEELNKSPYPKMISKVNFQEAYDVVKDSLLKELQIILSK